MANINSSIKNQLSTEIEKELTSIVSKLVLKLVNPQEPDYIAALTCNFPNALKKILTNNITNLDFRVCGCFIHQKPLAEFIDSKFSDMPSPEIGDLLIVYKEIDGKDEIYNALLLQAKVIKSNSAKTADALHQLVLYTQWPHFKYKRAGHLNGEKRDIYPKTIHSGAQYLLINNVTGKPLFGCATANKSLNVSLSLAEQLIRLIEFQVGDTFVSKTEPVIDDWSKMVWDLLEISKDSIFNRRKARFIDAERLGGDKLEELNAIVQKGDAIEALINMSSNDCFEFTEGESSGISIICIEGRIDDSIKRR